MNGCLGSCYRSLVSSCRSSFPVSTERQPRNLPALLAMLPARAGMFDLSRNTGLT